MSRDTHVTPALHYIRELFAQEDAFLQWIDRTIQQEDQPIHISAEEGKLLFFLTKLIGAKKVVEIGTLAGYSAVWMAQALPKDGILYTIEKDKARHDRTQSMLQGRDVAEKIRCMHGEASAVLKELSAKAPFDMVFIDADKQGYPAYLDWAEKNIRSGGLIVADNTLLSGSVYSDILPERVSASARDAMKDFNKRLADTTKFCSILLPAQDGTTIAMKL